MKTVPFVVVDGPNFHDCMNSMSGTKLGDAYPVMFILRIGGELYSVTVKVVGIEIKDTESSFVWGMRAQCTGRLYDFNPRKIHEVDVHVEFYGCIDRKGQGRITEPAYRHLKEE